MGFLEAMETAKWVIELAAGLVLAIAPVIAVLTGKQKFDLEKTIQAAKDVAHVVEEAQKKPNAPDLEKLLDMGADKVEELRRKKLSPKLREKAKARIKRHLEELKKK
jgi:hypothetical protein